MKSDTSLSRDISITEGDAQTDAAGKRLLSEKIILAWIMKECLDEYKDCAVKDIAEKYIEGKPEISTIPLLTDEYNPKITGDNTESKTISEGAIYYDIRFRATAPDGDGQIELIINVENQKDASPGYPIIKRALFYCCRMISSQYNTEFTHSDYDKIKKVYSIFICTNPLRPRRNTILKYRITEENMVGAAKEDIKNYDLLTAVILNIGESDNENYKGILKMIEVLMSDKRKADEKKRILQDEYGIEMTQTIEKELNQMNPWLQRAYDHGIEDGKKETELNIVKRFLALNKVPLEEISKATGLSIGELEKLRKDMGSRTK